MIQFIVKMLRHHKTISLLGLILIISVISACQGPDQNAIIDWTIPMDGEVISATSAIGIAFVEPMNTASVEEVFSISPQVDGTFTWDENTLWFNPNQAFTPDTSYEVKLRGELINREGKIIPGNVNWDFVIREPELLYYQLTGMWGELWRATAEGQDQRPLTESDGRVIDFTTDPAGDTIVYSLINDVEGSDLWLMDRDGYHQRLLIHCERDICREPSWSRNQTQIAYTRESFNPETGGFISSQIWIADAITGETNQLDRDRDAIGHSPSFSPDGNKLAYYDFEQLGIRVIDLPSSREFFFPSEVHNSGDWSPDSTKIIFTNIMPAAHEPFVEIYVADLATQEVTPAFTNPVLDTEFSQPRWSPVDSWVAVALRPVNSGISKALWALRLGSERQRLIEDEPSATFSAYQWDPWGQQLVYQRLELGISPSQISIWMWDWESGQSHQIIENGGRPLWLP